MNNPTSNPLGTFTTRDISPGAAQVKAPLAATKAKQDPHHTEADFKRDLGKATQRKSG
jgi:hypothetical protein